MRISRYDLEELLEEAGASPDDAIREKYGWSGNDECVGLVFDSDTQWEELIIALTGWVHEGGDQVLIPSVEDLKKTVRRARKDSMGRGIIVFWPYGGLEIYDPE